MSQNTQISRGATLDAVVNQIDNRADLYRPLVEASGVSWAAYRANVVQLLRTRPDVLDCTVLSIVNACIEAAHDGLRLDGKEATIGPRNVKVRKNPEKWEKQAIYIPMAHGLIQQIYRASEGKVKTVQVEVVHKNDEYRVSAGTNSQIIHFPVVDGEKGDIIGGYAIATFAEGDFISERLDAHDIAAIEASADNKTIWKGPFRGEMVKKSAVRRIRKRLPLGHGPIIDMEAVRMFPHMQQQAAALVDDTPRPTRASLADQSGTANGVDLDLGHDGDGVVVENEQTKGAKKKAEPKAKVSDGGAADNAPGTDLPGDEAEWRAWAFDVEDRVNKADAAGVDAIEAEEKPRVEAATPERADWVRQVFSDRRADLAGEET